MIVPDINLLVHAYNSESLSHQEARRWWESLLNGTRPVGLPWVCVLGFIRITTSRVILANPLPVADACGHARTWLAQPYVDIVKTDGPSPEFTDLRCPLFSDVLVH